MQIAHAQIIGNSKIEQRFENCTWPERKGNTRATRVTQARSVEKKQEVRELHLEAARGCCSASSASDSDAASLVPLKRRTGEDYTSPEVIVQVNLVTCSISGGVEVGSPAPGFWDASLFPRDVD